MKLALKPKPPPKPHLETLSMWLSDFRVVTPTEVKRSSLNVALIA